MRLPVSVGASDYDASRSLGLRGLGVWGFRGFRVSGFRRLGVSGFRGLGV